MLIPLSWILEKHKNDDFFELLKFKNEIVSGLTEIETDFYMKSEEWLSKPSLMDLYKWYLDVLEHVCPLLRKAFIEEYPGGRDGKYMNEFCEDMKNFYEES